MLTEIIDAEIQVLSNDLAAVTRGEGPEQPRVEAEKTRLLQAIHALQRIHTAALVGAVGEAQTHNHEKPFQIRAALKS